MLNQPSARSLRVGSTHSLRVGSAIVLRVGSALHLRVVSARSLRVGNARDVRVAALSLWPARGQHPRCDRASGSGRPPSPFTVAPSPPPSAVAAVHLLQ